MQTDAPSSPRAEPAPAAPADRSEITTLNRLFAFGTSATPIELLLTSGLLTLFAAVILAPHILHGALYLDDFANGAATLYPPGGSGFGHALSYFSSLTLYRPVLVVYVPLTFVISGTHASLQLAIAALWALTVAICGYGVLRALGVATLHALLIAALTLAYPWYDSLRMWSTASQASLSITFALAGLWVALTGLRHRSWRWHVGAATLYLTSVLTYEVTVPAILGAGLVYWAAFGWRSARLRWLADILAVAVGVAWVYGRETHKSFGLVADLTHARHIASAGVTMLGRSVISVGLEPRTAIAVTSLAAALVVGLVLSLARSPRLSNADSTLRAWIWMVVGGIVLAILGWIIFIPADPYYTPSVYGFTNRVNAVAGLGLIVLIYGTVGIAGFAIRRVSRAPALVGPLVTIGLAVLLGASYVRVLERHERIWNHAGQLEAEGMGEIKATFPHLASGTTLFVAGYPANETLGVPIFSTDWDLNGYLQLAYRSRHIDAYPVRDGLQLNCGQGGVSLIGDGAPATVVPYGDAWLVNLGTNRRTRPVSRQACAQAVPQYGPGPLYVTTAY